MWASGNRLDLGGNENKRVAVYELKAGQEYVFTMSGRSKYFKVDRIVLRHVDANAQTARDITQAETR